MVRKLASNDDWLRWGEFDPLWAVAAWPGKNRGRVDAWTDEAFYALGVSDWTDFLVHWERYGLDSASCVELGCGTGRITAALVGRFAAVHALDVSQGMLDYAKSRVTGAAFYLTDGVSIPLADNSVTAAFSCHTLQHLDSAAEAVPIFRELCRVLAPTGTMMVHLPIYSFPFARRPLELMFGIRRWLGNQKAALSRNLGRPVMRGTWYEMHWLLETLRKVGFVDVEVSIFPVRSNGDLHPFVFGRKP
jgi:ubiquinone/menaquinone biosynthesis C-methylase UbiE